METNLASFFNFRTPLAPVKAGQALRALPPRGEKITKRMRIISPSGGDVA